MQEGRVIAPEEQAKAAPPCAECGKAAINDRLYAMGKVFHRRCFSCAHCRSEIGSRRFVEYDGEAYLEGCYHKLFGGTAPLEMQEGARSHSSQYAIIVPLDVQKLGRDGLQRFSERHTELLTSVRRTLREHGISSLNCFVFSNKQALSRPAVCLTLSLPDTVDVATRLPELLHEERVCAEWDHLLTSVHDSTASKGKEWWASITRSV